MEEPLTEANNRGGPSASPLPLSPSYRKSFVVQAVVVAALGSFNFGFNLAVMNTSWPIVYKHFGWTEDMVQLRQGVMNSMVFVGAVYGRFSLSLCTAVGCFLGGSLLPRGRRFALVANSSTFIVGCIVCTLCGQMEWLLILGRLISGLAVGVVTVAVPNYISEIAPASVRGSFGVVHQLMINLGIVGGVAVGLPLSQPATKDPFSVEVTDFDRVWWRLMFLFSGGVALVQALFFMSCLRFETPSFLMDKGDSDGALMVLRKTYTTEEEAQSVHGAMRRAQEAQAGASGRGGAGASELTRVSITSAFGKPLYLKAIMIGCVRMTGVWVSVASLGVTCVNLVACLCASPLVERLGRKKLLMIGNLGQGVALLPAAVACVLEAVGGGVSEQVTEVLSIASVGGFVIFFAVAMGPVLWIYLSEMYTNDVKEAASALASALNWVFCIAMVFSSSFMPNSVAFTLFCVISFVAAAFVHVFVLETRGYSVGSSPYFPGVGSGVGPEGGDRDDSGRLGLEARGLVGSVRGSPPVSGSGELSKGKGGGERENGSAHLGV
uniref:Hexose transporter 1 n=1 Tax=Chromera velia CCMP2878 TaxID=1169474 RepID=A0A0K6SAU1_9ALVE|eukprot:Cvel_10963.t2-p1 / transcript=Cvel_10963.t2 / gene=Cvel_10963 / organism=Chromera_velia_CCMP2878 / gene_product=Plastidic glucose transporter 4, putative / transcript_product=Plastidic glucose transporter 4, putative / location=Cvel_scaffold674:34625-40738(-) / protein_length=549 / sequence_SO=supercontig / SO=protein_coding / is_pseudo=false